MKDLAITLAELQSGIYTINKLEMQRLAQELRVSSCLNKQCPLAQMITEMVREMRKHNPTKIHADRKAAD